MVLKMLSHITMPLFAGPPLCGDPEFLHLNCVFVEEVFLTAISNEAISPFHAPSHDQMPAILLEALKDEAENRQLPRSCDPGTPEITMGESECRKAKDVLQYMIDMAETEKETDPTNMAVRYIFTVIGSVHSVIAAVTDTIYEQTERPEYI